MQKRPRLALAPAAASAQPAAAGVVSGRSGPLTATLHAGTHHPHSTRKWPITYTVKVIK